MANSWTNCLFSILYFTGTVSGTIGAIFLLLGGVLILTSFVSFCPLYTFLGINTCKIKN
jgi:hypothetical protein